MVNQGRWGDDDLADDDPRFLLDFYEARGDEDICARAKPLYEQAIEANPTAELIRDHGYLLEWHGRPRGRRRGHHSAAMALAASLRERIAALEDHITQALSAHAD